MCIRDSSITVYGRTAGGNVAPLRTISGAATGLNFPFGLAVDTVNDELLVANDSGVSVRVAGRNVGGLVALLGAVVGLSCPCGVAVDTVNNELLVGHGS